MPATADGRMPLYVSPSGSNKIDEFERRRTAGWGTGFFAYWGGDIQWNSAWASFVARHPEGIPVLASPKGTVASNLHTFLGNLPQAWRDKFVISYWQEPEDDFTTDAQRAEFRASVETMASIVRPYGVKNAVHLQVWAFNPKNPDHVNTYKFVQGIGHAIDYLSISCYGPHDTTSQEWRDRVDWTVDFRDQYLPGKPWGITAAGIPVDAADPIGGAIRLDRAEKVRMLADYTRAQGGEGFGWFDHDGYNPGRDQLASKDPDLTDALIYAAGISLAAPTPPPPTGSGFLLQEGFENVPAGTAVVAGNTAFDLRSGAGTIVVDSGKARAGTRSVRVQMASESGSFGKTLEQTPAKYLSFYINPKAHPSNNTVLVYVSGADNVRTFQVLYNSDGSLKLQNANGVMIGANTASKLPFDRWSRVDVSLVGSTATLEMYPGSQADAPVGSASGGDKITGDVGATASTRWWFGARNSTIVDANLDGIRIASDALPQPFAPLAPPAPAPVTGSYFEVYFDDGTNLTGPMPTHALPAV